MDASVGWNVPLALAAGVVIAAACGLRAFLPLLAIGLATRAGLVSLRPEVRWLGDDAALIALVAATIVELAADKIPLLDHALDAVSTVLRPVAAAIAAFAVLSPVPSPWGPMIALVLGSSAFGLHAVKAKARIGSTALTAGVANPVLSVVEDVSAFSLTLVAVVAPIVALVLLVLLVWSVSRFWPRRRRATHTAV